MRRPFLSKKQLLKKKTFSTNKLQMSLLKITFLMKTSETEKIVKIFCMAFLFLKIFCLIHPGFILIFHKKRLFKFSSSEDYG
jgi:hypothetical protein